MTDVVVEERVEPLVSGLLPGLVQRVPELGRIRMGDKSEKGFPIRLRTFRLTSHSKLTLDAAAALYGGEVKPWTDAPNEGMFELITERDEIDVLVPAMFNVITQSYELWQGGTCERRCDGSVEAISGKDCLCAADGLEGPDRLCDIVTRLRVMLPRVPGLGVWRLDTQGYIAATSLPATVTLLARLMPGQWIPAVLRAEQRSSKVRIPDAAPGKPTTETHRFVVPVIDIPGTTIGQIVDGTSSHVPQIAEGERKTPPTAAERAAERRAQLEAQAGGSEATGTTDPKAGPTPNQTGNCQIASPRGEPCLATGEHTDHVNGVKRWPTRKQAQTAPPPPKGQEQGRAAVTAEPLEVEAAAGAVTAPAADLVEEAKRVFADDVVDGDYTPVQAGESDPAVQEGMRLLDQQRGGR